MADTPLSPPPATRRRLLVVSKIINQAGQYEPLEVRLPDSALRVTGLSASTMPLPGRIFQRRNAFVIFGEYDPAQPEAVATAKVLPAPQGSGVILVGNTDVRTVLAYGMDMADSLAGFDPQRHVGFYQDLTDELPLQALVVPAGKRLYYAQTTTVGRPKLVDGQGQPLPLVIEQGFDAVPTLLSRHQLSPSGLELTVAETRAYLCRVDPPAPRPIDSSYPWLGNQEGYYNGVLFPGDPNRF